MALLENLRRIVQGRLKDSSRTFLPTIDAAITMAWALYAASGDWWFLREPTRAAISIVSGTDRFTVDRTDIGRPLHVENEAGREIMRYKRRLDFKVYRSNFSDSVASGNAVVFTDIGLASGKRVFRVFPVPNTSTTYYLVYKEKGTLENLDVLPEEHTKALVHLIWSLMDSPNEMEPGVWRAMTYKEDQMAIYWLGEMLRLEGAVEDEDPEFLLDSLNEDRLLEIENL
jgi:hypothetical protein